MDKPNNGNREHKKIFISYSHSDKGFVERLAEALRKHGEDVCWDKWEIASENSLIDKIFEQGLSNASAFITIVSPDSIKSKWIREDMNVNTARRME